MTIKLTAKQRIIVRNSDDAFKVMREILMREDKIDREKEHFWVVGLAQNHRIRYVELISMGGVRRTTVEPMNVFRWSVMKGCVKVILVHNHPSGNLKPSPEDIDLTDHLFQVGRILNIEVLDHLIISTKSYMSFANTGLLEKLAESLKYVPQFEQIERIRTEEKKIREEAVRIERENAKNEKDKAVKEKAIEMAKNSIKEGLPVELIVKLTGLTKKEIERIKV